MHVSAFQVSNRYVVNRRWWNTDDTNASFWDSSLPGTQDEALDDGELRAKLGSVVRQHPHGNYPPLSNVLSCSHKSSIWEADGIGVTTEPRIILV